MNAVGVLTGGHDGVLVLHVIAVGIVVYDHIDRALFADDSNGGSTITGETCWSSDPSGSVSKSSSILFAIAI